MIPVKVQLHAVRPDRHWAALQNTALSGVGFPLFIKGEVMDDSADRGADKTGFCYLGNDKYHTLVFHNV